jgi:hypothetical protein
MKIMEKRFLKHAQEDPAVSGRHTSTPTQYFDMFSSIAAESFYVPDIPQKQFCYVKPDDLFLCGYSAGDALRLGYDF